MGLLLVCTLTEVELRDLSLVEGCLVDDIQCMG
jgi:hypothetical protein